jgi:hypothetical protein
VAAQINGDYLKTILKFFYQPGPDTAVHGPAMHQQQGLSLPEYLIMQLGSFIHNA